MVNTGLPSKACETCRRRRVRCDLRRPGCLRCEKIGRPCSGYRDLSKPNRVFRIETQSSYTDNRSRKTSQDAENVVKHDSRGGTSLEPDSQSGELSRPNSRSLSPPARFNLPLSHPIVEAWDIHVIPLLMTRFSHSEPGGYRAYGLLECLPQLLLNEKSGSVLHIACHAVGYAYLTNTKRSSSLALSHSRAYGQALSALRKAIIDPALQKHDSTLLSVWLLCLYELILGTPVSERSELGPMNWRVHSNALENLLRVRGREQFATKTGGELFQLAYHTVQINALQLGSQAPEESHEWFEAIQSSPLVDQTVLFTMLLFCDSATRICNTARRIIQKGTPEELLLTITNTMQACHDLEESLKGQFGNLIRPASSPIGLQSFIELRTQNHIDACFLRLHYCVLELLSHAAKIPSLSTDQLKEHTQLRQVIVLRCRARADRILATLPRFLATPGTSPTGPMGSLVDILRLMWPLRLISNSPVVHESQKTAAKAALSRIGYEEGIMQAVISI